MNTDNFFGKAVDRCYTSRWRNKHDADMGILEYMAGSLWKCVGLKVCAGQYETPLPDAFEMQTMALVDRSNVETPRLGLGHTIGVPEAGITLDAFCTYDPKNSNSQNIEYDPNIGKFTKVIYYDESWNQPGNGLPVCIKTTSMDTALIGLCIAFPFETPNDVSKLLAVAMACHARLGASSPLRDVVCIADVRAFLGLHAMLATYRIEWLEWPIRLVKSETFFVEANPISNQNRAARVGPSRANKRSLPDICPPH